MSHILHGIDLADLDRIEKMITDHGEHFLERVFTPAEQEYAGKHRQYLERYAARFAAKEAVMKLIGMGWRGKIAWTDVEVVNNSMGQPFVNLKGEAKRIADKLGVKQISISITHAAKLAIASAVAIVE